MEVEDKRRERIPNLDDFFNRRACCRTTRRGAQHIGGELEVAEWLGCYQVFCGHGRGSIISLSARKKKDDECRPRL